MSVISSNFDTPAEPFELEKYRSVATADPDYTPKDVKYLSHPYESRIQWLRDEEGGVFSEWLADSFIKVRAPSDAFREHQVKEWTKIQTRAGNLFGLGTLGTLVGVASLCAIAFFLNPPFIMNIGLHAVACAVCLAFRKSQIAPFDLASEQIQKWGKSPPKEILVQKYRAFVHSFDHKLKSDERTLSTSMFHPLEMKEFYVRIIVSYCRKFLKEEASNADRKTNLEEFFRYRFFSIEALEHIFGAVPEQLKLLSEDDKRLRAIKKSNDLILIEIKSEVRARSATLITAYEKQRQEMSALWIQWQQRRLDNIKSELDSQQAKQIFKMNERALIKGYNITLEPVHAYFDKKIAEVNGQYQTILKQIEMTEKGEFLDYYYTLVQELLSKALTAFRNQGYQPIDFKDYFLKQLPPSSPLPVPPHYFPPQFPQGPSDIRRPFDPVPVTG